MEGTPPPSALAAPELTLDSMPATRLAMRSTRRARLLEDPLIRIGPPVYIGIAALCVVLAAVSDYLTLHSHVGTTPFTYDLLPQLLKFVDGGLLLVIVVALWPLMAYWHQRNLELWSQIDDVVPSAPDSEPTRPSLAHVCRTQWDHPMRFALMALCWVPILLYIVSLSAPAVLVACAFGNCSADDNLRDFARNPASAWMWLLLKYALPALFVSIVSAFIWRLLCVSHLLVHVTNQEPIVVRPWHPDGAGGLAPIGKMCVLSATPAMIVATGVTLLPVLLHYGLVETRVAALGGFAALFICVPSLVLIFVRPLLSSHRLMLRERARDQAWLVSHVDRAEVSLRAAIDAGDWSMISRSSENLKMLHGLTPSRFPVWPIAFGVGSIALVVQLAGIAVSITTVVKAITGTAGR